MLRYITSCSNAGYGINRDNKHFRAPFGFRELDPKTRCYVPITVEKRVLEIGRQISPIDHVSEDDPPT